MAVKSNLYLYQLIGFLKPELRILLSQMPVGQCTFFITGTPASYYHQHSHYHHHPSSVVERLLGAQVCKDMPTEYQTCSSYISITNSSWYPQVFYFKLWAWSSKNLVLVFRAKISEVQDYIQRLGGQKCGQLELGEKIVKFRELWLHYLKII